MGKLTEMYQYDDIHTKCFHIAFDLDDNGDIYQVIEGWCDEIFDEIPNFALGKIKAQEISKDSPRKAVKQSMQLLYQVKEVQEANIDYLGGKMTEKSEDKYLKRGEFGELILYYLLDKKLSKPQLISKIYFKDSFNSVVHGFDAVHYEKETSQLWIGESKFYKDGSSALRNLSDDLYSHFNVNFFNQEFTIINNRFKDLGIEDDNIKNLIDPETKFLSKLININACFFALFDSEIIDTFLFEEGTDCPDSEFLKDLNQLARDAREKFNTQNKEFKNKESLRIHLFLFPVVSKYELVKKLHEKLKKEQN